MADKITVRLRVDDCPKPMTMESWSKWVDEQLIAGGFPIQNGLTGGAIRRYDDPSDFGVTIWEWIPDELMRLDSTDAAGERDK